MSGTVRLLRIAADLMSEEGENSEYDRACVEIACTMLGVSTDARDDVAGLLRAIQAAS